MTSSYIDVITNRNFRNLWLGQILSQISLNMLIFVLAIRVYQLTSSNISVSLMFLCFGIPAIIVGILAGSIVDNLDKRQVMFYCNLSRVFLLFIFFLTGKYLAALYILTIIISIITQFFIPAEAPSIPNLVGEEKLLTANSLFTISYYLSVVVGFIISGPMMKYFGPYVYLFMMLLMFLAAYFIYLIPPFKSRKEEKLELNFMTIGKIIDEGICFINVNQRVKQSLILMTFSQALISTLGVLGPGFADQVLSIDLTDASYLVMGPVALGLVLGSFLVGSFGIRFLKGSIILVGIILTGVTLFFLSLMTKAQIPIFHLLDTNIFINNMMVSLILLFLLGISSSFISVPANTILQQDSKKEMCSRVYGVLTSLTGGVSLIPVVFSGALADIFGVGKTLLIIGSCVIFVGVYQYIKRQKGFIIIREK